MQLSVRGMKQMTYCSSLQGMLGFCGRVRFLRECKVRRGQSPRQRATIDYAQNKLDWSSGTSYLQLLVRITSLAHLPGRDLGIMRDHER